MAKLSWYGRGFQDAPVSYCLCVTEDQYRLAMKQANIKFPTPFVNEGSAATCHIIQRTSDNGLKKPIAVVCIETDSSYELTEQYALIIHESVHVFQEMMRQWGEENVGDETQAYFIQRISLDLMSDLEDHYQKNPHAHPDYRKRNKARRDVVRQRRRDNADRT